MGFRDSLSGGVRLVRAVPSPIGFCQFGAVQLHPEAGCSGRRRERRSVCLWRRRRAPRRPALADGRQCRPRHERCVGSLREDSGRKLIFYPPSHGFGPATPCRNADFHALRVETGAGSCKKETPASREAGVVSGRPETPGGTRRAGPLRRCGSSRPRGWIRAGSGRSASRRRARRSCPWRRRRGDRRRARRARASRRASSCRARRRTFRRT